MSRTVSFRCSEELDEFLDTEADRRMTTKSTVAQMIVADYARESDFSLSGEAGESGRQETLEGVNESKGDVLEQFPEVWYRPDGKYSYAVYVPDDAGTHDEGSTRYYKTRNGAANGVRRWYS